MKQVLYKKIFHFYDRDFILTLEFIGYKENPILLYGHLTPWRTVWSLAVGVHICASLPLCIIHSAVADKRISKWNFYLCGNLFTKRPAKQNKNLHLWLWVQLRLAQLRIELGEWDMNIMVRISLLFLFLWQITLVHLKNADICPKSDNSEVYLKSTCLTSTAAVVFWQKMWKITYFPYIRTW